MIISYAQLGIDYKVSSFNWEYLTNSIFLIFPQNIHGSKELYLTRILKILKIVGFADYVVMLLYMLPQYGMQRYV